MVRRRDPFAVPTAVDQLTPEGRLPTEAETPKWNVVGQSPAGILISGIGGHWMGIIWTIVIGLVAGIVAKFIVPGSKNEPSGFVLTAILGIVGAIVASYLGKAVGWYEPGEGAGFIGAIVGAVIILVVWGFIAARSATR